MEIEKIIADLKLQGLDEQKILLSLQQMVEEGKITPEDLEKAKQILANNNVANEKSEAGKLFGLDLI